MVPRNVDPRRYRIGWWLGMAFLVVSLSTLTTAALFSTAFLLQYVVVHVR